MSKIKGLKEKLAKNWKDANSYFDKADKEGRELLDLTEREAFDRIMSENDSIESDIKRLEALESSEAESSEAFAEKADSLKMSKDEHKTKYTKAFEKYVRAQKLTPEEMDSISTRGTSTQVSSTTTLGGFLVPEEWSNDINIARAYIGSIRQIADVYNTSGGGALPIPSFDDTAESGAIQTEGSAPTVGDITMAETVLNDHTYTSKILKVSFQLMNDESVNLTEKIGAALGRRIEKRQAGDFVSGDGSSKATGFIGAIDPYNAGGDGGTLTSDVIYDLVSSVDPDYAANGTFVFNNSTLGTIKKLSVGSSDNRPLWVPSLAQGQPATIDGKPYLVCADMASEASAAKYMAFGDFKNYAVRTVGGMSLLRMDERFADALSVGFLAYERADGKYVGASSGAIKYVYRTAT